MALITYKGISQNSSISKSITDEEFASIDCSVKTRSVKMNIDTGEKTWLTPPSILEKLGHFDLDPCTPSIMPWVTADRMISLPIEVEVACPCGFVRTEPGNGLDIDWSGKRVWCNPPYGREGIPFIKKFCEHDGGGYLLLFARTETKVWQKLIFPYANSIMFLSGRLSFFAIFI